MHESTRRTFLNHSAKFGTGTTLSVLLGNLLAQSSHAADSAGVAGYGPLEPVRDEISQLTLLMLPKGFRYMSTGWTGTQMSDGHRTPPAHDGMAVINFEGNRVTLCRNHEVSNPGNPYGDPEMAYDRRGRGGCSNLVFDTAKEQFVESWISLVGSSRNCAGGPTPWGTWLTAEETLDDPTDEAYRGRRFERGPYEKTHGWIFEVPAKGISDAKPLKAMGRFRHEAVAVDPKTSIVYETEDRDTSGFYRFLPNEPRKLSAGGRLQMMKVPGHEDLTGGQTIGTKWKVEWVDIDDPELPHSPGTRDGYGVFKQGKAKDATTFARLEGCWYDNGLVYFVSTSGGAVKQGQIWQYEPKNDTLSLLYESHDPNTLSMPDNVCASPRGGLVLCEDSGRDEIRQIGLGSDGIPFPLVANNVVLHGELGHRGDFRGSEWAGCTFSPDGKWLFANIQNPGITFAITGPWEHGPL